MELGLYQHFKGKFYLVVDIARHSETLEDMMIYNSLHGKFDTWVSPKSMFEEKVATSEGQTIPRFRFLSPIDIPTKNETEEDDDDDNSELLAVYDNEKDLQEAIAILEDYEIEYVIQREKLTPKPNHLTSDLLLKICVSENDFDEALDALSDET